MKFGMGPVTGIDCIAPKGEEKCRIYWCSAAIITEIPPGGGFF